MPRWRVNSSNGTAAGLDADFIPYCPYCGNILQPVALKLLNFQLNEPDWWERGVKNGYAIDVECWCSSCGYWVPFGVACPKAHWEKIHSETKQIFDQSACPEMDKVPKHISRA